MPRPRRSPPARPLWRSTSTVRIGVSSCLLGARVRWDGGHKHDPFVVDVVGRLVDWVAVCPEVEMGLPIPRDTLRLVRTSGETRLVVHATGADHSAAMRAWATRRLRAIDKRGLSGFVLKKGSPSCGLERVRVYDARGVLTKSGRGLFAGALVAHFPLLPVEEEGSLADDRLREAFIERVFAYRRLRDLFARCWALSDLASFHAAHRPQIMARSVKADGRLTRLVARADAVPRDELEAAYSRAFMDAFAAPASPRRQANRLG